MISKNIYVFLYGVKLLRMSVLCYKLLFVQLHRPFSLISIGYDARPYDVMMEDWISLKSIKEV